MDYSRLLPLYARFQCLIVLYALFLSSYASPSEVITWSRIPEVAVPSLTQPRGPEETPYHQRPSLKSAGTMPPQFPGPGGGNFPGRPTQNPTTTIAMSSQPTVFQPTTLLSITSETSILQITATEPSLESLTTTSTIGAFSSIASSPSAFSTSSVNSGATTFPTLGTSIQVASSLGFATTYTTTFTATPTGLSGFTASAVNGGAGASTSGPTPLPENVITQQSIVGIAVGIGVWLLIIIAVLSCLLWRKRKRGRGVTRLEDDTPTETRSMDDGEMAQVPISRRAPSIQPNEPSVTLPQRAPSLPPPFISRPASPDGQIPPPLRSHPVSRSGEDLVSPVSPVSPIVPHRASIGAALASPVLPQLNRDPRGSYPLPAPSVSTDHTLSRNPSTSSENAKGAIVRMRSLNQGDRSPLSPDEISELPPSLGKLNSWLEENRRRSRMNKTGSASLVENPAPI
jgi:hypothetical protein